MPKESNKKYVDTSKITLRKISKAAAKEMIEKNHYSHKFSSTRYALGIFYTETNEDSFFEGEVENLIGCMTYGYPVGRMTAESVSDLVKIDEVLELTRLFIHDGYGSNVESYTIGQSFKWLKENDKSIKALISYADPQVGHLRGIYQALNFLYQGDTMRLVDSYALKYNLSDPLWIHAKTIYDIYGSNNAEILKQKIGKTFWLKLEERKHRYIYVIADKKERKNILKNLKHPILPYPKSLESFTEQITEVTV